MNGEMSRSMWECEKKGAEWVRSNNTRAHDIAGRRHYYAAHDKARAIYQGSRCRGQKLGKIDFLSLLAPFP